jgi:ABC-2 type transport system permease protein
MSDAAGAVPAGQPARRVRAAPGRLWMVWWRVFVRELSQLWIGGKAVYLLLGYSIYLGFKSWSQVKTSQENLIPPKEMVFANLQVVYYVGTLVGLVVAADSISGERERGTLEALLLTPAHRVQLILGKFLAALSPWPVIVLISIPFLHLLAQGDPVWRHSLYWGGIVGSLLVIAFTGVGMLVSFWSNSNRVSLFVSLGIYLIVLLPTTWASRAVRGDFAKTVQRLNPLEGANELLEKILVNNRSIHAYELWLRTSEVFAAVVVAVLFLYAGSRLRPEARQR